MATIAAPPPMPLSRDWPTLLPAAPGDAIETRIAAAMEHLRNLHECGEIEWPILFPRLPTQWRFSTIEAGLRAIDDRCRNEHPMNE
jgi:hypothetical protein